MNIWTFWGFNWKRRIRFGDLDDGWVIPNHHPIQKQPRFPQPEISPPDFLNRMDNRWFPPPKKNTSNVGRGAWQDLGSGGARIFFHHFFACQVFRWRFSLTYSWSTRGPKGSQWEKTHKPCEVWCENFARSFEKDCQGRSSPPTKRWEKTPLKRWMFVDSFLFWRHLVLVLLPGFQS